MKFNQEMAQIRACPVPSSIETTPTVIMMPMIIVIMIIMMTMIIIAKIAMITMINIINRWQR